MDEQFKNLCISRFVSATVICTALQFTCILSCLLCMNISLLHPIKWIWGSVAAVFSMYSLVMAVPIAVMVFLNGLFMGEPYMVVPKSSEKISRLVKKCIKYLVRMITGAFLTSLFLHYVYTDNDQEWMPHVLYLTGYGYTVFMQYSWEENTKVPQIQPLKMIRVKEDTIDILRGGLTESKNASLVFTLMKSFYILITYGKFGIFLNLRLGFTIWILCSFINSSFKLMQAVYKIYLTDYTQFALKKDSTLFLGDALACSKIPVVQKLAALDFYRLAENHCIERRRILFELSAIGGHPANWRKVYENTSTVLQTFMLDLNQIIDTKVKPVHESWPILYEISDKKTFVPTTRQLNEERGIRSLTSPTKTVPLKAEETLVKSSFSFEIPAVKRFTQTIKRFTEKNKEAQVYELLLRDGQTISWICRGLAGIVEHSLTEDKYGVLQENLANILKILFELQQCVEKVNTMSLTKVKTSAKYTNLRNATRHALLRITKALRPFLEHIPGLDQDVALQTRDYYHAGYAR